ncbi:hypothetical protein [Pseudomonas sp. VD9]|uniref:hypothetical protein n=1 Tax=Pseudomonas sp. VD9 TaxID=3342076 RepID=UPI003C6CBEF0
MKTRDLAHPLLLAGALLFCQAALAHGPVFDCYIEHDDWVKCEAGYTDGSSAVGRKIHVQDTSNKVLIEGTVGNDNSFTFQDRRLLRGVSRGGEPWRHDPIL